MVFYCKIIFLKASNSRGNILHDSLFSLGQKRKAEMILSLLIKAASGARDVTRQHLKVSKFGTSVRCVVPHKSQENSYSLDRWNMLWFRFCSPKKTALKRHQSTSGCVSKQRLLDFTANPGVITVLPPHPCYGDCMVSGAERL